MAHRFLNNPSNFCTHSQNKGKPWKKELQHALLMMNKFWKRAGKVYLEVILANPGQNCSSESLQARIRFEIPL
jgi:hypothetical protein